MIGYLLIGAVLVTALLVGWLLDSRADDSLPRYGNGRNCDQCGRFCIPVELREVYGYRLVCEECGKKDVRREIALKADTVQWLVARNALGDHYVDEVNASRDDQGRITHAALCATNWFVLHWEQSKRDGAV